ncbi:hypothetical protein ACR3IL_09540 [Streptococcus iniae]|nr:hypothetical protein BKX95_10115 [Streptococcus iniae]
MKEKREYDQLIANDVYKVDSKKVKEPFKKEDLVANDKYLITENTLDNNLNGMQAMAVAPIVNGKTDIRAKIIVMYNI